ncbi:tail fiber protein [Escherichia coli]|uniref:tail fiber protein n=1 Tax=Escherichia coli TaxID=562 RepID=UPI00226E7184|nr:tail fiber protein [Escherichia coli]MCX9885979.1 tail fiber protein [Escherichia coli]MCY0010215.1 tail fiber protein [Escherichia coli]MCY0210163.1 tail fiber protein [Escherichia coli]
MNDVTVVTSVTYPSPESLALVADVQYHEPYLSAALNRKFRGIVDPGFYAGFLPKPGGGMKLLITSVDGDKTAGAASVNIGEFYQVTIQQRKDISLALSAGKKYAIVLKGRYLLGEDSYQVNTASHIHAAEFVARTYTDSYQLGDGELLVCTVNIPAGVSAITQEMIDVSDRIDLTIGIEISDSVTSTRSDVAASSLAVKKAYDLAKSKYTAQDASTTQKGLVQLSSATNSTSEVLAATPKAVKAAYDLANGKYTAQDATTTQKGIVQLSSDTNSTSETLAATPKAVKAAYDLAAGKAPSSHTHPWNQITGVPTASLTAKGITQLSSATNSTSEVLAATPKAVKAAYDLANGKYTAQDATTTQKGIVQLSSDTNSTSETLAATPKAVKAAYDLAAGKAPSSHTHPWNQITGVPTASLTAKGITQLSSATNSTSEVLAATPKAVKAAYDLANGKYTAQDATTTQKGIVQLSSDTNSTSETLAATPKAVKAAYDLAAGKAPSSHTHPWNQITGVPTASLTAKGITQLSSATNSTSEVLAATPKAVKAAYDLANGKYTAQDATTTQKGIVQLSSDTNSTSETLAATPKAVKAAYDLAAGKAPSSHTHPWNQITGVPTASLTAKGITQLSSATNSTSEVLAATPKAVKAAYDLANGKYTAQDATTTQKGIVQLSSDTNSTSETLAATPKAVKAAYDLAAGKAPSSHTHPWNQITGVPTASLTAKGITQLSSATNSTSEVLAATPKAVKAAYDLANGKYTAQDATTTQKGIVQLSSDTNSTSETLAATPKAVKAAYDLAAGKAPSSHTHPWNQITGVPTASLTAKGITQLSSATNSTSEVLAATPKAVKAAYDLANGKQAADATLTALAALATAADKLPYFTGVDRAALTALTSVGRAILSKPSIQSVLNYLGLGETIDKASGAMQKSANGYDISDVSAFRNALQLGTAATRDVGADNASKLLDLDSFRSMMSGNGYIYIPCIATTGNPVKLMLQWGMVATQKGVDAGYALPFAFPYAGLFATGNRGTPGYNAAMNVRIASRTHISIQNWSPSGEGTEDCCFIALGY